MKILGLDLSLVATGVVVIEGDELEPEMPAQILHSQVIAPGELRGMERLNYLVGEVFKQVRTEGGAALVDIIAIEGYSFSRNGNAVYQIAELGGVVRWLLSRYRFPYMEIPVTEWRKHLFGQGNLRKELVRLEAFKRYGVEFRSLDVLEAWCVATAAWRRTLGLYTPQHRDRSRSRKAAEMAVAP